MLSNVTKLLAVTALVGLTSFANTAKAATNIAPVISGTPGTSVTAGLWYKFVTIATDANGDSLTYKIVGKPVWANFNTSTGKLSGTPTSANVGTYANIVISVSDGRISKSLPAFAITVKTVNRAPTISGTPVVAGTVGQPYAFRPTATDLDGDRLTFKIVAKPVWANFDNSTGKLSGTPTSANVGTYANIVISLSDGKISKSLPAFAITVKTVNRAPTISGTPVSAGTAGQPYAFGPTANDLDGNALTFSIANKPSWATFDATTGTLYGTPTAASSTSNVTISVSDGKVSASLAPFSINILPAPLANATLSWTPPTQNTDGTAITNLAGYRVSYGNATGTYSVELNISGAATNSVVIEDLQPGAYYFAVKAVNANGLVSVFSTEVSKVL